MNKSSNKKISGGMKLSKNNKHIIIPKWRFDLTFKNSPFTKNLNESKKEHMRKQLKFTEETGFSISYWTHAELINNVIKKILKLKDNDLSTMSITEDGVGAGGNTLAFARKFKSINSIEFNPTHVRYLKHNLPILLKPEDYKKVNIIQGDFSKLHDKYKQDIVFLDPPWGGPNYKEMKPLYMYYGETEVGQIINKLRKKVKMIIMKAPLNYTIDFDNYWILTITRWRKK